MTGTTGSFPSRLAGGEPLIAGTRVLDGKCWRESTATRVPRCLARAMPNLLRMSSPRRGTLDGSTDGQTWPTVSSKPSARPAGDWSPSPAEPALFATRGTRRWIALDNVPSVPRSAAMQRARRIDAEATEARSRPGTRWNLTPRQTLGLPCLDRVRRFGRLCGNPNSTAVPIRGGITADEGFPFFGPLCGSA
jgi:hypothetical protein